MYFIYNLLTSLIVFVFLGIPIKILMQSFPELILPLCVSAVVLLIIILVSSTQRKNSRTLHIDRHTVTLTDTYKMDIWHPKERWMKVDEATKFSVIHLDFFERLFTVDFFRVDSAYHIEITRNGETFFFPCHDEKEQSQISKRIREFLT